MILSDGMIKKLADIGFMASGSGYSKHAFAIFGGVEIARPDNVLPAIGYAMEFMNKKKYPEAIKILKTQGLEKDPENPAIQAFIGLVLMLDGHNKESEAYLDSIDTHNDSAVTNMVDELLEYIHSH